MAIQTFWMLKQDLIWLSRLFGYTNKISFGYPDFLGTQTKSELAIQTFWMHKQDLIWLSRLFGYTNKI